MSSEITNEPCTCDGAVAKVKKARTTRGHRGRRGAAGGGAGGVMRHPLPDGWLSQLALAIDTRNGIETGTLIAHRDLMVETATREDERKQHASHDRARTIWVTRCGDCPCRGECNDWEMCGLGRELQTGTEGDCEGHHAHVPDWCPIRLAGGRVVLEVQS